MGRPGAIRGLRYAAGLAARGTRVLVLGMVDFLYPPHCASCGIGMGSAAALCGACWAEVSFIDMPRCAVLGLPFSRDHGEGAVSARAMAEPPDFDRARAVALHDGPARVLVHGLKYRDRTDLAPMMARWMARAGAAELAAADLILPIPLHRNRLVLRRFNQAAELARALSKLTGLAYEPRLLLRRKATRQQVGLGRKARQENVRGAFRVAEDGASRLAGKRVILVDDVLTTGATVSAAARALKRAGASDVSVLTFAMAAPEPI